jgi:hypothetical protein
MDINTRRVERELVVLRSVVGALQALVMAGEEDKRRPPTYYPNPNNPALVAFSIGRVPLDQLAGFLTTLHEQLGTNQIGVMLDAVVFKPVAYKSAEDAKNHSLKKTMFLNFSLCTWTREAMLRLTAEKCPNDKFYDVAALIPILDQLDADIEVVKFENQCGESERPRRPNSNRKPSKPLRAPLISVEQAMSVMESLGLGSAAEKLLPALGIMPKGKREVEDAQG